MNFGVISIFPQMFSALTNFGVTGRAFQQGLCSVEYFNPRDYSEDVHKSVDDRPYGGGPGMVMMYEPLKGAILAARDMVPGPVVYLSPQGKSLSVERLRDLHQQRNVTFLCGRYEGIDERIVRKHVDEEISIGDYVISGGELAAMVIMDALIRLIPGALGHELSAEEDSFSHGLLDTSHYTRPQTVDGMGVPGILLTGNHQEISRWRQLQSYERTLARRPELLAKYHDNPDSEGN
jgi:tRNA (guanine37-N1)-methyltransferase